MSSDRWQKMAVSVAVRRGDVDKGIAMGEVSGMEKGLVLGESKGKEESNVACVRSLSKHLSIRYEEAMDLLEIEESLRPSILRLLTEEA